MNETQITLTGWLGTDVTLRQVGETQHVASFRVASTPSRFKDGEWVKGTTSWHTVKAWNRLALHVAASLHSGDPVLVHGRLVADVWEREGRTTTSYEVIATRGRPRPQPRHRGLHPPGAERPARAGRDRRSDVTEPRAA